MLKPPWSLLSTLCAFASLQIMMVVIHIALCFVFPCRLLVSHCIVDYLHAACTSFLSYNDLYVGSWIHSVLPLPLNTFFSSPPFITSNRTCCNVIHTCLHVVSIIDLTLQACPILFSSSHKAFTPIHYHAMPFAWNLILATTCGCLLRCICSLLLYVFFHHSRTLFTIALLYSLTTLNTITF